MPTKKSCFLKRLEGKRGTQKTNLRTWGDKRRAKENIGSRPRRKIRGRNPGNWKNQTEPTVLKSHERGWGELEWEE